MLMIICCWQICHYRRQTPDSLAQRHIVTVTSLYLIKRQLILECGPMPNLMVALCSTPQSLADFANAFNSLHRSAMLLSVRDCLPELYAFCLSSYSQPSFLYFGSHVLLSEEGPQQGDPLGPLLFVLPFIHSFLRWVPTLHWVTWTTSH